MPQQTVMAVDLYSGDRVQDFAQTRAAGVPLAILKATEGQSIRDSTYAARRDAARAAGLLVAAYHFSTTAPVQAQIDNFLGAVMPDPDPTLRLVLDWEVYDNAFLSVSDMKAFLAAVDERTGHPTVIYASLSFLNERLGSARDPYLGSHPLWLAAYRDSVAAPTPQASWPSCALWQYTGDGVGGFPRAIAGIPGNSSGQVDLNSAPDMTLAAFRAAWLGDTSDANYPHDARWVQSRLAAAGFYRGDIDGDIGPQSIAAMADYIQARGG